MIDITQPLEAVHKETGRVVPMTYDKASTHSGDRYKGSFYTKECPCPNTTNSGWYADGEDMCGNKLWIIRNVAVPIDTSRPLELSDGTAVTFSRCTSSGSIMVRVPSGHTLSGPRRFLPNGQRPSSMSHGSHLTLRNTPATYIGDTTLLNHRLPMITRGGRLPVTIVALLAASNQMVVEVDYGFNGGKTLERRNLDGTPVSARKSYSSLTRTNGDDVINAPVRTTVYVNVYADGSQGTARHTTKDAAFTRSKVGKCRIGVLELISDDAVVIKSNYTRLVPFTRPNGYDPSVATPQ